MRAVSLALRGLWWRRAASLTILLVGVVCAAVAAAGPTYLAAARDAVVRTTLTAADATSQGTGVSVSQPVAQGFVNGRLTRAVSAGFADLVGRGLYTPAVGSVVGVVHRELTSEGSGERTPLASRDGLCRHIVLRSGSCVSDDDPGGVLLTPAAAADLGVRLGGVVSFADFSFRQPSRTLRVRGLYEPLDPRGTYWFNATNQFFDAPGSTDAVLAASTLWPDATIRSDAGVTARDDLALRPGSVRAADLSRLTDDVQSAVAAVNGTGAQAADSGLSATTNLADVVYTARLAETSVSVPVASVAGQLVVLTVAVLFLVMAASADSRAPEIALGKLHGLRTRAAVLHAVLEPVLLLAAAVPVGVAVCALGLRVVAAHTFGAGATIHVGLTTWLGALGAGVGGAVATLIAASGVLRRPVLEQWQRTERGPRRRAWVVEAVVVTVAVGGAVELAQRRPTAGTADVLPIIAPALLAVAFALVGARLLPLLARAGFGLTRGRRAVAAFVALRQLARRGEDRRVFALLCATVALLVFGLSSQAVFDRNRLDRARAEVGAARVVSVESGAGDVSAVVDRVDPSGRWAAAVFATTTTITAGDALNGDPGGQDAVGGTSTVPTLLVVDPARFAAVADWRADYGPGGDAGSLLAPIATAAPTAPSFRGTSLHLAGTVDAVAGGAVRLHLGLTDVRGAQLEVDLGALPTGRPAAFDRTAAVPGCAQGCELRRVSVFATASATDPATVTLDLSAVTASASGSLLSALRRTSWTPLDAVVPDTTARETIAPYGAGVRVSVSATAEPNDATVGFGDYAGLPDAIPGVVTRSQLSSIVGQPVALDDGEQAAIAVRPSAVTILPRAGDAGIVVSRRWLAAILPEGSDYYAPNQVWLSPAAPADVPDRLRAAGLRVESVQTVSGRAAILARTGPSFAVTMLVLGGLAAAVLAVAGAVAVLFVASRRRLYELAALRALGLRPVRMVASVLLEQAAVAVIACAVGLGAGLLGTRIALATVPEFADRPAFPPLLVQLPFGRAVLAALAVALSVGLVAGVADLGLVRRADAARLREAQQ